jgi:hypothetical protein
VGAKGGGTEEGGEVTEVVYIAVLEQGDEVDFVGGTLDEERVAGVEPPDAPVRKDAERAPREQDVVADLRHWIAFCRPAIERQTEPFRVSHGQRPLDLRRGAGASAASRSAALA